MVSEEHILDHALDTFIGGMFYVGKEIKSSEGKQAEGIFVCSYSYILVSVDSGPSPCYTDSPGTYQKASLQKLPRHVDFRISFGLPFLILGVHKYP